MTATIHRLTIPNWRPARTNELIYRHWARARRRKKADAEMVGGYALAAGLQPATGKRRVSLEITLHFFARTDSEWLLQDARIYQAGDGYVRGAVNLWDERERLVAYALQRAVLRPRAF